MTGKYPGRFFYASLSVYRGNNTNTNRDSSSNAHRYSKTRVANNKLAI